MSVIQPIGPLNTQGNSFASNVYVVGEVLISVIALLGALGLVFYSGDEGTKLAGSGLLSAVTVFWFQRRASEQSSNNLAMLADGKITQLLEQQKEQQIRTDALVGLMASVARGVNADVKQAAAASEVPSAVAVS